MDDTPVDVIGIILAAIIMFIVPLILISENLKVHWNLVIQG